MRIAIIGAGNVATHFALALSEAGMPPTQIWSRTMESAQALAERVGCRATNSLTDIMTDADACIISVKDRYVRGIAERVCRERPKTVFMHTSGSVGMDVFDGLSDNCGVLYPMQTFSKDKALDFKKIPCFVEGNNEASTETITKLASTISDNVHYMTSDDRKWLHLAAVFACNFSNACYVVADGILRRNGLDFTVLQPLIEETVSKLGTLAPIDAQTGPAVRGDQNIMDSQAAMLADNESVQTLYIKMSEIIAQQQSHKHVGRVSKT
ncbi:Rossmann-like and DUF2520 domain-containing protein [Prevotella sp.]|uniref:Rossmann-like and DUF2520 domain-containing protein n=1 Tax=Prevotella sp. TaxID=59823 RepID=UPI0025F66B1C|nr:Rossmann-like and DUF2520 domain-containing protein [Prevotella sp.]